MVAAFLLIRSLQEPSSPVVQFPESGVSGRWNLEGTTYVLINGDFYQDHGGGNYAFVQNYYDPDFYAKHYAVEGDAIFVSSHDDPPMRIRTRNEFHDGFESYETVRDLILTTKNIEGKEVIVDGVKTYDPDELSTRWTALTLQSSQSPGVKDYVALRKHILEEDGDFLDNRVEPSEAQAHSGSRSVRFYSSAKSSSMVTAKASMSTDTLHFVKGDDFWFSGWYFFEQGMATTVMDLESTWLEGHSGIRILFSKQGHPYIELKAFNKPSWRNTTFTVPRNQWVHIKAHFLLDEKAGKLELWIDDELVVDGTGQTLPLANTVLNALEVGLSATSDETILFLDDLRVSTEEL